MSSSPADADDATEDDAWIDGTSWWSGVDLRRVDNVESGIKELKAMLKGDKSSSGDAQVSVQLGSGCIYAHGFGSLRGSFLLNISAQLGGIKKP